MMRIAFSLLCILSCALAFEFEDCGSEVGKFSEIIISSCTTADEKCNLPRGTKIDVTAKFATTKDISKIEARAFGVLLDVPVPFPLEKPDVCKDPDSGVSCPLKKDQENVYKSSFLVEKTTPALSVEIIWQFINENDEKIVCVKFPARVK